jgi:hypothetical protein
MSAAMKSFASGIGWGMFIGCALYGWVTLIGKMGFCL